MAKPNITVAGQAQAWGDLSEGSSNMLTNLFAVSVRLPSSLKTLFKGAGGVVSMLCAAVTLPKETLEVKDIPTKLSSYPIVVGKKISTFELVFREQLGAPVLTLMNAWHKLCCDARGNGIGWPSDYRGEVWVMALTGDGVPFYYWGFKGAFPEDRYQDVKFANDPKGEVELTGTFRYIEMMDEAEALAGAGSNFSINLASAAQVIGV
jgi:hypothetical protein